MCVSLAFGVPARLADQTKASMSGLVGVLTASDLGEVFTFGADLPKRGVAGGLPTG
jgi:hypothetical protein